MFDAEPDWPRVFLGELIASSNAGVSVNSESRRSEPGEVGVLKTSSVGGGRFDPLEHKAVLDSERYRVRTAVAANSIILSRMNTPDLVGENAYVEEDHPDLFLPDRLWLLRTNERADCRWLSFFMQSELFRRQLDDIATGTSGSMKNISKARLAELSLLLPALDEQRRIAEVLRSVDEAIGATEAVLGAVAGVRQSVLDALIHALEEAYGGDQVLSDVAEVRTGLAKNKNADGRHVQLPYLRVANVQDGWFDLSEMQEIAVEANKVERYSLKDGDVLLTEGGDYDKLGRGGVWKAQVHPCLHQNHVFCVRSDRTRLLPEFLALITQSYLGRAYFLSCAKRTTNLASINSSQLKALPVPLPDLERQGAVVTEIGCIDVLIEREEEKLRSLERLRASQGADLLSGRVRVPA